MCDSLRRNIRRCSLAALPDIKHSPTDSHCETEETPRRPTHPPRQSSFGRRHASFDSPREVPFPSQGPSSLHPTIIGFTPDLDSYSTVLVPPAAGPSHSEGWKQPIEHELLSLVADVRDRTLYSPHNTMVTSSAAALATSTSGEHNGLGGFSSIHGRFEDVMLKRSASGPVYPGHPGDWNTDHLRPHLLHQPLSQPLSLHQQQLEFPVNDTMHTSASTSPPSGIQSPHLARPSSAESLPLPTQMPFSTLPTLPGSPAGGADNGSNGHSTPSSPPLPKRNPCPQHSTLLLSSQPPSLTRARCAQPVPTTPTSILENYVSPRPKISPSSSSGSASSRNSGSISSFPPPTPPTIHTPPPPPQEPGSSDMEERTSGSGCPKRKRPYEPFLSHAPPPVDSYIAVETTEPEYRLIVRLPGYKRDCITLATRRRRILHIVADSWEAGGGHFERRISFGYDAELAQVRAEFDGEHLRIIIPRRLPPTGWCDTLSP